MTPLLTAFALFLAGQADAPAQPATAPAAAAAPARPAGAPRDDYQYVAWCYGALRGFVDLHDQVMPEVRRIESEFRRPGSKLSDDMKVYDEEMRAAHADLKRYQAALTAAEKASLQPINTVGAQQVAKGRAMWNGGPDVTKARLAQEWMGWEPPRDCGTTADALEKRAVLMGPAFKVNAEEDAAPAVDAKPADTATK